MESFSVNNRDNIINSYGTTPTLPFDVEGVLTEKNGKNIKVESNVNGKIVEYSLRLKEEAEAKVGENIEIKKEDIVSYKVEEKKENTNNVEEGRKAQAIIGDLGLEYTEENIRMIEHLLKNGIQITKINIKSYVKSREYLNKIIDKLDTNISLKLMNKGINIGEESLQKIAEALENIESEKPSRSLREIFKLDRQLTYKEAEIISKEIYGQKMGKDIYDTIIQLHKEDLPITKENIDKTVEILSKVKNLKTLEEDIYVKLLGEEKDFNIENLYKMNNSYTKTHIKINDEAKDFQSFTILEEANIESLKEILSDLEIENTNENLKILREFVVEDMEMDREKYEAIVSMKAGVKELINLLDTKTIADLNNDNINILEEDIFTLIDIMKEKTEQNELDLSKDIDSAKDIDTSLTKESLQEIKDQLKTLGSIEDKDLLRLIKKGEDFNISSIKEIKERENLRGLSLEERTLGKTIQISKIFTSLGERLNINVASYTVRNGERASLENLYNNRGETSTSRLDPVESKEINLIQEEYIKLKNNLTTNIIKESIKDGKVLEQMPINELNKFIEEKISRYRAIDEMAKDIGQVKGNEEKIIPLIMKNNLEMTLKEIKDINSFLNGEKGLASILKNTIDPENHNYKEEYKEAIKLLGEKVSDSIKNGGKSFKEDYKEFKNILDNPEGRNRDPRDNPKKQEYMKIHQKLSKKDMVLQIPIQMDNEYKNLNLIVPDVNKVIDKNNMRFFISLDTGNLGLVDMDIQVKGKEVEIKMREENSAINSRIEDLKESLEKIGYTLRESRELVID